MVAVTLELLSRQCFTSKLIALQKCLVQHSSLYLFKEKKIKLNDVGKFRSQLEKDLDVHVNNDFLYCSAYPIKF